ncbi:MAG TPA: DinB family protein [Gemmatimonadaceae bacterium]|nr:DinB family protein [Gemmatimonadaceae bacterium]
MNHLRALMDHMAWADERILASLRQPGVPPRALEIYAHVLGTEHNWLTRLEERPRTILVWPTLTLEECAQLSAENQRAFGAYVDRLASADLRRTVHYRNSAGVEFDSPIEDILLHVAMHGSYHRGQVTMLVRDAGAEPQPTDFIEFVRGAPAATRASVAPAPVHDR